MSRYGQVFDNTTIGERAVILTDPEDHPERVLVMHMHATPGGRVAAEHCHPTLTERFHVLRGRVGFLIDGAQQTLGPRDSGRVAPKARHDWWQVGEEPAEVVVEMDPGDRFIEMIAMMCRLARKGMVGRRGLPSLLQLAVIANAYRDVMVFTSHRPSVQRSLLLVLASIGHAFGLRPSDPQYLTSEDVVAPDPEALGLLTPDGRLAT